MLISNHFFSTAMQLACNLFLLSQIIGRSKTADINFSQSILEASLFHKIPDKASVCSRSRKNEVNRLKLHQAIFSLTKPAAGSRKELPKHSVDSGNLPARVACNKPLITRVDSGQFQIKLRTIFKTGISG